MSNSWKTSSLASIVAAAALVSGGCGRPESRSDRRISAAEEVVEMRGMSKDAADLARKETLQWLTAQEIMRRERETAIPRRAPTVTPQPVAQPEGQPVADHAMPAAEPDRTAQTAQVQALMLQPLAAN